MTVETILSERGAIYGDYSAVATTSQKLKQAIHAGSSWDLMTDRERESLDMICNKLARIANGLPHRDSWVDLSGYAELVARMMEP